MKGLDHLVLCGRDLEAMRVFYASLGFTLTPPARHPFGTGNSLVQLDGVFLELLTVVAPDDIPPYRPGHFSFAAFNRDFLAKREGFSMLVLDSADARADVARYRRDGLQAYDPFDFSRQAKLPDGEVVTVGFSLAFASMDGAPRAGFFCCQQHAPQHFWKPDYQRHANTARTVSQLWLVADEPPTHAAFLEGWSGIAPIVDAQALILETARGTLIVESPVNFQMRTGLAAPVLDEGPLFAGFCLGVADLSQASDHIVRAGLPLIERHGRLMIAPEHAFGTAIAFEPISQA
jgi:hypothetical protein